MNPGNLGQIRGKVSYLVNFNPGQTDQDFRGPAAYPNQRLNDAINEAYTEEVILGKQNGSRDFFRSTHSMTWTADAATMPIPAAVKGKDIEAIRDDSSQTPGPIVVLWSGITDGAGLFKVDTDTWGWYPTPSSERTLTILYVGSAAEMEQDDQEPVLIPQDYRDLLVWSAAIILKLIADEKVPKSWQERQEQLRWQWWKTLSMGSPHQYPAPSIRHMYGDTTRSF